MVYKLLYKIHYPLKSDIRSAPELAIKQNIKWSLLLCSIKLTERCQKEFSFPIYWM